jgi:TolB protein
MSSPTPLLLVAAQSSSPKFLRRFVLNVSQQIKAFAILLVLALSCSQAVRAQDWFRAGIGLGDATKPRVAVADFGPRSDAAKSHSALFSQVVRDDLAFSGILELVSPSMYPTSQPTLPNELRNLDWTNAPANANMVAFGNLVESPTEVAIQAWLYDVHNPSSQAVVGKIYRGTPSDAQVRKFAHQFADEIINKLSGGLPSVAGTQIAFVSARGSGSKEIWAMDYDGANQHPLTNAPLHLPHPTLVAGRLPHRVHLLRVNTSKSPARKSACTAIDAGKVLSFPRFKGHQQRPGLVPGRRATRLLLLHGRQSRTLRHRRQRQSTPSASPSPTRPAPAPAWNPKTGQTVVYVGDRGGSAQALL